MLCTFEATNISPIFISTVEVLNRGLVSPSVKYLSVVSLCLCVSYCSKCSPGLNRSNVKPSGHFMATRSGTAPGLAKNIDKEGALEEGV